MQELGLEALPEFTKIHAGCATLDGKRLVVVGPARSGKTTRHGDPSHDDHPLMLGRQEPVPGARPTASRRSERPRG